MKKTAIIVLIVSFLTITSTSLYAGGGYGHYSSRHYYSHHRYSHHNYRHYDDGYAIAGLIIGVVLGGIIFNALTSPPPRPAHAPQYVVIPETQIGMPLSRMCIQERKVGGEWQRSPYDGSNIWVTFPYPIPRRVQVPCY